MGDMAWNEKTTVFYYQTLHPLPTLSGYLPTRICAFAYRYNAPRKT